MPTTQISLETEADGSGELIAAQSLNEGESLTVYLIGRDADGSFVENLAADTDTFILDGTAGTLTVAGDSKSAAFTSSGRGVCTINATATVSAVELEASSGDLIVNPIVTLAELKSRLAIGVDADGNPITDKDTLLLQWITDVTGQLESQLQQPARLAVATEILDGSGCDTIYLNQGRIRSLYGATEAERLSNLQYRESVSGGWLTLLTDEDNVSFDARGGWEVSLLDGFIFPLGRKNIRLTYWSGLPDAALSEIKQLMLELIQVQWMESKTGGDLLGKVSTNISLGGTSHSLNLRSDIDSRWKKVIDRYRKVAL